MRGRKGEIGGRKDRRLEGEKVRRSEKQKIGRTPVKSASLVFCEEFNWASGGRVRMWEERKRDEGPREDCLWQE